MNVSGSIRRTLGSAVVLCSTWLSAQQPTSEFVFCSYNLKNWLSMERGDRRHGLLIAPKPPAEKKRVVEILAEIHPDVLGVCEVGTLEDVHELQHLLLRSGVDLPHIERAHGGDKTRSLALLSRFPIASRNSQNSLEYQIGDVTFPLQRGLLDATVQISTELQIRFVGVHLKSKRAVPEADESLMRRNEAHLLRNHLDRIFSLNPQVKLLAYGDFNEHRNEPTIAEIIGSRASAGYMSELLLRDRHGLVWTHFWDAADVYSRLDFLFSSRALRPLIDLRKASIYSVADFDQASDHRPLVLKIKTS